MRSTDLCEGIRRVSEGASLRMYEYYKGRFDYVKELEGVHLVDGYHEGYGWIQIEDGLFEYSPQLEMAHSG